MHGHGHADASTTRPPVPRRVALGLALAIGAGLAAALVGMALLWPPHQHVPVPAGFSASTPTVDGTVVLTRTYDCQYGGELPGATPQTPVRCETSQVRLTSSISGGPQAGTLVSVDTNTGAGSNVLRTGDRIVLATTTGPDGQVYEFVDFQRHAPMLILGLLFALIVVAVARWRGAGAILGLVIAWAVLARFTFPALLETRNALAVALVTSALVISVVLFIAHGINARTATAVLGTLTSLGLVGLLGAAAIHFTHLTGVGSEDVTFLQSAVTRLRLDGLLLAGMIIGSLGVLNDVTVTQASAVWEIHEANPSRSAREVYRSGMRVGRDHIASTIYTLILAYAGAALPLLLLFDLGGRGFTSVITSETIAEEVIRTLVGSAGLVASVPITTALAALIVTAATRAAGPPHAGSREAAVLDDEDSIGPAQGGRPV